VYRILTLQLEDGSHLNCVCPPELAIHVGDLCVADQNRVLEFGRVARLAEHFNAADLKALAQFLWHHEIVLGDEVVNALIQRVPTGRMAETLKGIERAASYAEQTGVEFDLGDAVNLSVNEPRTPPDPAAGPRPEPAWRKAERELLPVLERLFGPGWQVSPRIQAPNAEPGETLGSTIPEYYRPASQGQAGRAFEVKRFDVGEMGIAPDGTVRAQPSQATIDALARARRQVAGRRWALPAGTEQSLVFNVSGQGVTDVAAVGQQLRAMLSQQLVAYDTLYVQNGGVLTPIP